MPNAFWQNSMTCEKPINRDNSYGDEMVGNFCWIRARYPQSQTWTYRVTSTATQLLCANYKSLDFRFRVAGEFKEENKFVKLIFGNHEFIFARTQFSQRVSQLFSFPSAAIHHETRNLKRRLHTSWKDNLDFPILELRTNAKERRALPYRKK